MNLNAWINSAWMMTCRGEWKAFRRALLAPEETQAAVLNEILRANRDCEFGRRYRFGEIRNVREFQERVPLEDEGAMQDDLARMAAGEQNIRISQRVRLFEPTSGTTSARKLIPYTWSLQKQYQRAIHAWIYNLYRHRPAVRHGRAYWSISPALGKRERTSGGIPIGFDDDSAYLGGLGRLLVSQVFAVPTEVSKLQNLDDVRYMTLLWLLAAGDLSLISVWSPTFLTILMEGLEEWRDDFDTDLGVDRVPRRFRGSKSWEQRHLRAPRCGFDRVARVRSILASEYPLPVKIQQLWPRLALISCWADASAQGFVSEFQCLFPGVELQPKGLMATEGCVSFPLVGLTGAALALRSHFFEFEETDSPQGEPAASSGMCLLAHELEFGKRYKIVMTTGGGLYRYRLGDVVEVVGFEGGCPLLRFLGRSGRGSDLVGEKLAEPFVRSVLEPLLIESGVFPRFALIVPVTGVKPYYRLYLQLTSSDRVDFSTKRFADRLQQGLEQNPYYRHAVQIGQLQRVDVCLLNPYAESGWRIYERRFLSEGRKAGDIKPALLDSRPGWGELLEPIRLNESREPNHVSAEAGLLPANRG